jgi:spermidine synthase
VLKATLCEIDRSVIDLSLQHYPEIAAGAIDNPRSDIVIADGLKYVADAKERFDAIIVDSSEPIGPSAVLHTREFFADCRRALKDGGIFVTQNGLPFLFPSHLAETTEALASFYQRAAPFLCTQPCYFGGPFALNWASDDGDLLEVSAKKLAKRQDKRGVQTRYWTPAVHVAAFALPGYVRTVAEEALERAAAKQPRRGGKKKE